MVTPTPASEYVFLDGLASLSSENGRIVTVVRLDQITHVRLNEAARIANLILFNGDSVNVHIEDKGLFKSFASDLVASFREAVA